MIDLVELFDSYTRCGFKPLPLYPGTKIPMVKDWQNDWSADKYRDYFIATPNANMGILLGDIIDVEGDDTHANEIIFDLARNVPHSMFRSSKSVHHLFMSPNMNITVCKIGRIEFRGKRHQSVVPPSVHKNGTEYKWCRESVFPPPPMPQKMIDFLLEHKKEIKVVRPRINGKKSNHCISVCNLCKQKVFVHKNRLVLETQAFRILDSKWLCQLCRPIDVRPICRTFRD